MDDQKFLQINNLKRQLEQESKDVKYAQKKVEEIQKQLQFEKNSFERFLLKEDKQSVIKDV